MPDVSPVSRLTTAALIAWAASLAILVAADGSPLWCIIRAGIVIAVAAAVWRLSHRNNRLASLLLIAIGVTGLAAGIAFGLRFISADGFSWRAAAGLVQLATALFLIASGMWAFISTFSRGRRFIAGPALVLAIALTALTVTPAVMVTNMPSIAITATPEDFDLEAGDVSFTADDGIEIHAWLIPSTNGAAVVLRHGAGSTGSNVLAQAGVLARHGYGVLITDARGHGRSGGRAMDFGWYGDADIKAAVSFLAAQPGIDPERIGVIGLSMGSEEAIGAAEADPRIAAVVAEGATARTDADKAWLADVYGFRGRIQLGLEWLQYSLTDLLTGAARPVSLADAVKAAAPRPVLLIAAGKVPDESNAAEHIRQASPGSVQVWVVPGAGHTGGLATAPDEWESRVNGPGKGSVGVGSAALSRGSPQPAGSSAREWRSGRSIGRRFFMITCLTTDYTPYTTKSMFQLTACSDIIPMMKQSSTFALAITASVFLLITCVGCKQQPSAPAPEDLYWVQNPDTGLFQTNDLERARLEIPFEIDLPTFIPDDIKPYPYLIQGILGRSADPKGSDISLHFGYAKHYIGIVKENRVIGPVYDEPGSKYMDINGIRVRVLTENSQIEFAWMVGDLYTSVTVEGYNETTAKRIVRSMIR